MNSKTEKTQEKNLQQMKGQSLLDWFKDNRHLFPIGEILSKYGITLQGESVHCLFHNENTPSMHIYHNTNSFHCFGCGKTGDIIDIITEVEQISKSEALEKLRDSKLLTGQIKPRTGQKKASESEPKTDGRQFSDIYKDFLSMLEAEPAIAHLTRRHIEKHITRKAGIKGITDWSETFAELQKRYPFETLMKCGLAAKYDDEVYFSFKKHPLIIPYFDTDGETVLNLQGRDIGGKATVKYRFLSGIETPLYNLPVLQTLKEGDTVYLCEGVPDVLSLLSLGLPSIGLGGVSAFKDRYKELLKPYKVCLAFDNDKAGLTAFLKIKHALHNSTLFNFEAFKNDCGVSKPCKDINEVLVEAGASGREHFRQVQAGSIGCPFD